jgi:ABC-type nitrate/sulfonate/bicarbonate transport system substrate-binding protein/outer membrane protein OmpA-like peptidoglycan-associated protein
MRLYYSIKPKKIWKKNSVLRALCLGGMTQLAAFSQGADFIKAPPLKDVVNVSVESCSNSKEINVPLITWGGDIATVYANGNSLGTTTGSIFDKNGLKVKLQREDVFTQQVSNFLQCKTPFLRGTMAMIQMASEVANKNSKTKIHVIHQMTWSAGGDALVVKGNIKNPKDLRGKTIALQAYGPHVDYLGKILSDSGLSIRDVTLKWTKDLTGTAASPGNALYDSNIDAALVIIPDALKLTSNGKVGTGAEDSVKGARILVSTKTANKIIADVYAVRADFLEANKATVESFVKSLLQAQDALVALVKNKATKSSEYKAAIQAAAKILLDSEQAFSDTEGMYADASFVGYPGQKSFFASTQNPRNFEAISKEAGASVVGAGLLGQVGDIKKVSWNFDAFTSGGASQDAAAESPKFNADKVTQVAVQRSQSKSEEGELYKFEVTFKPNQNGFAESDYASAFKKAIELASTYGGAVVTVEGHSDPLGYLKKKKAGEAGVVLSQIKQAAKNLSLTRAAAVREALLKYAKKSGVTLDPGQFAVVGNGIEKPKNGKCGEDPCAPANESEWLANMRVEFRIIQVEAEENIFESL